MRILVTGSSGFVGRALVAELSRRGREVMGLSRRAHETSLQGDLLDPASLARALSVFAPQVIYNLAAQTNLKSEPTGGYLANTTGVTNLLLAVRAAPSVERTIWMSSQLVARPSAAPKSDTYYDPVDRYGESKAMGEQMVRAANGGGKPWCIVRSTTVWGPGISEHYAAVIRVIQRNLYFHVGARPLRKSYSYIENLAAQLASLATAPAGLFNGQTFYLADSDPIELRAWSEAFAAEFGTSVRNMPEGAARMLGAAGDMLSAVGIKAPLTSHRLANMLTEHVYDVSPIDAIHGRTAISWQEGVKRTAAWLRSGRIAPDDPALRPA